ncbi:MAG TPA: biotin carboxylase N-terminal domain-containing protein [Humidesulfovibrio sp.]|uniref:biotin carboxylase N-terminal domain-containing protein n=1 Tax=Humidesulfovibrio sp. TaxID=2910988 RepID=UPI002B90769D|nr:biotin carboxylase N-terminal domain-containing protein [Humidesulfovibrio sp.]HWR03856.1 biotin carboxylase N-terminal domain-containing protein [Humidesulfovibrio sp.]
MAPHRILIANRGEIAMRIIRACAGLGHDFVCVHTAADAASGHVRLARELGGSQSLCRIRSYQDANELFAVADACGATAVHPGYGFFAEDFRFARRAEKRDRPLIFIGPSWGVIRDLGDKINTKRIARSLSVPTIPGSDRPIFDEMEAVDLAEAIFAFQADQGITEGCVLVKASAGGGGMGIEDVYDLDTFRSVYRRIRNYAKRNLSDEGVLIEQRIFDFNHLEVQVAAERGGKNAVHFGTRNCSVQSLGRQKRIEVAPGFDPASLSYAFDAAGVLGAITSHSVNMSKAVGYDNVGTWEWIVTPKGDPFLMEVNTRIQVENGVSGVISRLRGRPETDRGVDIISEQIRLALGEPLGYTQDDVRFEGVGIEYRIIAEDPAERFTPCLGRIERFAWKPEPWLTVYTQVPTAAGGEAYEIPMDFDPNLALAIVWGADLAQARERGEAFLQNLSLGGTDTTGAPLRTNLAFLLARTQTILHF